MKSWTDLLRRFISTKTNGRCENMFGFFFFFVFFFQVASSGTPTGDGLLNETETFAQIFWQIWEKEGLFFFGVLWRRIISNLFLNFFPPNKRLRFAER
jgi:hypothetical protein